ncbi:MAG: ABC transporter permease [Acidobacteriia bacterium]|nr:ABC transporter permease [Terriglobia bacterium]
MMRLRAGLAARRENVASAFRSIREQKLRSSLTCLGIVIGVATVIVMVSLIQGFNERFISAFRQFGATLVQFQIHEDEFGGGPPREEERLRPVLTVDDARAIQRYAWAIRYVSPERWQFSQTEVRWRGARANGATVGGVTHQYPDANSHFVEHGRFFTEGEERHAAEVAVIGKGIVEALFPRLDPLGRVIEINGRPFRVVGVFEDKGGFLDGGGANSQMVIPMGIFDRIWPETQKTYGCVIATIPWKPEWLNLAIEQGTEILRDRRGLRFDQPNNFAIRTPDRYIRLFRQITGGISAAMIAIAGISLVIGGVGVMNIMLMNVTQRTREIGIRKALGARRRDILQQFLTEAMTLTMVGGAAGVMAGLGVARLVAQFSPFPATFSPAAIVAGLVVAALVGLFFGTYPAWRAARLDPIESLRHE